MQKIYIAGGSGMLGTTFYNLFNNQYDLLVSDIDKNENWVNYLDFREKNKYIESVEFFNPNYLFHFGALTDLEYCDKYTMNCLSTNLDSVKTAVEISNKLNIKLIFISTAGIFNSNTQNIFSDSDIPNPKGNYASSKYLSEQHIQKNCKDYIIFRAGWMFGGFEKDKKFVGKILNKIKNGETELNVVNDKFGTPTYTSAFSKNIIHVLENSDIKNRIYNMACEGLNVSRLDVAKEIINILKLDIKINSVASSFFNKEYSSERPSSEQLINKNLIENNLNIMPNWKQALNEYLKDYKI